MAAAVGAALRALGKDRSGEEAAWLWLFTTMRRAFPLDEHPELTDSKLKSFARQEAFREREFLRRMDERLKIKVPIALRKPEPEKAVDTVLRVERSYLRFHEEAAATRVHAAIQRDRLKALSPEGAYWRMSPLVKEHTPDCIAMAMGGWWPWSVLDRIHPPMHPGCPCELLSHAEARDLGLMGDVIPDTTGADRRADEIIAAYGLIQEAWWLQTDPPEEINLAIAHLLELGEGMWQPAYDCGPTRDPGASTAADPQVLQIEAQEGQIALMESASKKLDTKGEEKHAKKGIMVALYPPRSVQDDLALRDGENPEHVHLTLAYLGKTDDVGDEDGAIAAVRRWAEGCPPLKGEVSGYGYFMGNEDGDGGKVTYASVDLPELPHQRQRLVDVLDKGGWPPNRDHGYTPHMTLDYASRRPPMDEPLPLAFERVSLVWGESRYDFPLTGRPLNEEIMEGLVDHAKFELERAGLFSEDSDYDGMLGEEIMKIVKVFADGGHSGGSAAMTTAALEKLLRFQPLTPLTSDPDEWIHHGKEIAGKEMWQNRRNPAAFSYDGGKTWEIMEARERLPLGPLDIEELQWDRRYAEGTIWGGRFMPRRGGFAPRVSLTDVLRRIFGTDAPQVVGRGKPRPTLKVKHQDPGMASPPTPGKPGPPPRRPGTPARDFDETAAEIRKIAEDLAAQSGAKLQLGKITSNPERPDTEGWRSFEGEVEIGGMASVALGRYAEMSRRGQRIDDDTAADHYHAVRTTMHESLHSVNPLTGREYSDPSHFAIEEALTEELAHTMTVEYLQANGGYDTLRWLSRRPEDPRAQGVYLPQRAGLQAVLDAAEVPLADRRELLHQLSFTMGPDQREAVLAGLLSKAEGITPTTGRKRVRGIMGQTADLDPLGLGAPVLRSSNLVDRRDHVIAGTTVRVGDRYEGVVTDAGYDSDGRWMVEVETDLGDGNMSWRYPQPEEIEVLKDAPRRRLKGDKVEGPIREDQAVEVTQLNGETETMHVLQIEDEDAHGWRAVAVDSAGRTVLLRPTAIQGIKAAKVKRARKGASQSKKGRKKGSEGPERAPKGRSQRRQRKVKLVDVSGPRGFDARNYEDPRRSLLTKVEALPEGETLELSDGSKIVRGQKGSAIIFRPDGTSERYLLYNKLVNEEIKGIAERHGLKPDEWDPQGAWRARR